MYKLHIKENNECGGFYREGIHNYMPVPNIDITTQLWQYLLTLGKFKLKDEVVLENRVYTVVDIELFEKVVSESTENPEPSLVEKLRVLEQELSITQDALNEMLFNITSHFEL